MSMNELDKKKVKNRLFQPLEIKYYYFFSKNDGNKDEDA